MMQPATLEIDRVGKRFGAAKAVDSVSLQVAAGEFVALLGPSGCGKSTLLNLVAGFLEPDAGDIRIDAASILRVPPHARDIGVVFQNYALFPHMSVAENIAFGLKMRRLGRKEIDRRVAAALDTVRLPQVADRTPRQLSGGQQQRIALARALVIEPRLVLLDEPFSAIDKNLRADMQVELKRIQRELGITTVFVTHDQAEALSLSDRIAVMAHGAVQQFATPSELYRRPANEFVASFIGEVNRLPCRARGEGDEVVLAASHIELRLPRSRAGGSVAAQVGETHLYLRPDALSVRDGADTRANLGTGRVEAHVYQGTHTDMIVSCDSGWTVRVRHLGHEAMERWPRGQRVGVEANLAEAHVFSD